MSKKPQAKKEIVFQFKTTNRTENSTKDGINTVKRVNFVDVNEDNDISYKLSVFGEPYRVDEFLELLNCQVLDDQIQAVIKKQLRPKKTLTEKLDEAATDPILSELDDPVGPMDSS